MLDTSSTMLESNNQTYIYVNAFVDELQRSGIHNVIICPGSRSTPLALAIAQHPALRIWMHVDERSAAFFGLGMVKRLGLPVALLCTSGTAAANFMPAIVEANLSHLPLLVLTADRPPELRDCGAPQAIDQNRLYGTHVKWFVEVALPETTNEALRYIRTLANRAAALTQAIPAGPVHLNFPFREPLTPEPPTNPPQTTQQLRDYVAWQGRSGNDSYVRVSNARQEVVPKATIQYLIEKMNETSDGLIIVGPLDNPALAEPLTKLAQHLGYPILTDPLSQLRCGPHDHSHIVTTYNALLHCTSFMQHMPPRLILRFGAMPTAKTLLLYLKHFPDCPQVIINGHGSWEEPTQLADMLIHVDPAAFCRDVLRIVDSHTDRHPSQDIPSPWLTTWQRCDSLARETLHTKLEEFEPLFEGRVFSELVNLLPNGTNLFAGNSMPVRDLDSFFWGSQHHIHIQGNRGASGIDGIISTALGISAASNKDEPCVLVIGDLSFFHDLNGLLAARLHQLNLTIILINNDGGGIFSFLPQANYPEYFEQLFGTPTGLDFHPVVQMYGGQFRRIATWQEFRQAVTDSLASGGLNVIEVPTERTKNVEMHRQLWLAVEQDLNSLAPSYKQHMVPPRFHGRNTQHCVHWSYDRIQINGVHIGIIQHGSTAQDAPVLVLLHGFTGSAASWGRLLDDFVLFGMRIIALDMLGHGQSDAPDDPQRYSMQHCQIDIISVLQTLGIKRKEAILLGYSMGGRIALYCAFSGYFRALILESASPGLSIPAEREQRRISDEALADRIEREGIEAFVNYWEHIPLFASQRNLPIERWNAQRAQRLTNRPHGLANSLRGIGTGVQPPLEQHLPTFTLPVLLITGELDSKYCAIAQQMVQQLPGAQLQIVPNAGHTVHLEQPELFVTLVHKFCTT